MSRQLYAPGNVKPGERPPVPPNSYPPRPPASSTQPPASGPPDGNWLAERRSPEAGSRGAA
jgi:hypothetical protein